MLAPAKQFKSSKIVPAKVSNMSQSDSISLSGFLEKFKSVKSILRESSFLIIFINVSKPGIYISLTSDMKIYLSSNKYLFVMINILLQSLYIKSICFSLIEVGRTPSEEPKKNCFKVLGYSPVNLVMCVKELSLNFISCIAEKTCKFKQLKYQSLKFTCRY